MPRSNALARAAKTVFWSSVAAMVIGCGPGDDGRGGGSLPATLGGQGDTAGGNGTDAATTGDAGADTTSGDDTDVDSGGLKLDVHGGDLGDGNPEGGGEDGCEKVDLLFVIDDSISMDDEQANLIASFPDFINGMQTELADTDGYHVGVITTDAYAGDQTCAPGQMGTLVTQTGGAQSSNAVCAPYSSGARYMTEQDDLATAFACAAQVGTDGDPDERPMEALLTAFSPGQLAGGGCNEGFVRDDALLVVVIITDEEDDHEMGGCNALPGSGSPGEPLDWYEQLVAVKGGDEASIVVLSLVGPRDAPLCPELDKCNIGSPGAEVANRIIDFTEMFSYGFVGGICHPFGPFFQEAIGTIKSACNDFVPPG